MGFLEAIRFLTILPVPGKRASSERALARSVVYFPVVGALLGALLALLGEGLYAMGWGQLAAAVVLVVWVALTRGLHLDGLADTADGLLGGWDRAHRLAIMRDSRLGTFGALALFAALLLKFTLVGQLPTQWRTPSLVLAPTLARWAMVQAIVCYPPARREGLGQAFQRHVGGKDFVLSSALALALSLLICGLWGVAILAGALLVALSFNGGVTRATGGLTGDTYGALCEVEELWVLTSVVLLQTGGAL